MKLLVRNLARTTTEEELLSLFEALGKVQSCKIVLDKKTGKSKGFAFIEMPRPGDAKAAVKTLNAKDVSGNIIRVKKAVAKNTEVETSVKKEQTPETKEPEKTETKEPKVNKSTEKVTEKVTEKKNADINRNIWSK